MKFKYSFSFSFSFSFFLLRASAIGRVVYSQQNEIKNPEMALHFIGIKPPRPDSAGARPDTPPIPAGRRGNDAYRAGKFQNENENGNENEFLIVSSSLPLYFGRISIRSYRSSPHSFITSSHHLLMSVPEIS